MSLTFDQLEKAVIVREISEKSQNFLKWAKENKKSPENFCDWDKIITDFYKEKGEEWKEPVAINCPYGFMGYEIFHPPEPKIEEIKPIGFDNDGDFDWDLILNDSDDEDQDSDDNQDENKQDSPRFESGDEEVEKNSCYQQDNPKKKGSKAYERYNIYKTAKTFEEYKILHKEAREKIKGSTTWRADLQYDFNKGFCFGFPDIKLSLNNDKLVIQ